MNEGIGVLAAMNALLVHHGYRTEKEVEMNKTKIAAADAATDTIFEHWNEASDALARTIYTNGAGVLSDPSTAKDALVAARDAIENALVICRETSWPATDDYDE